MDLSCIGDTNCELETVLGIATKFMVSCYSVPECETMTKAKLKLWKKKVANNRSAAPELKTLPATTEAFYENVKRAHLQSAIWHNSLCIYPPSLNPLEFG